MARTNVVMPQMGESITNGTITKWHKQPGDAIALDEILLEISTDKVESEIPSSVEGRVEVLHFDEGDTVDVGGVIAEIEEDTSIPFSDQKTSAKSPQPSPWAEEPCPPSAEHPASSEHPEDSGEMAAKHQKGGEQRFYTPLVKALAREYAVPLADLAGLTGSGAGGRINKKDFMQYIESRKSQATEAAPSPAAPTVGLAAPGQERVEVIPMDHMRKVIARNMLESKMTSPHVHSVEEVDMTQLVKFREAFKQEFKAQEGFSLTYTHFIMYAIIQGLKEFPLVNASLEGDNIIVKKAINLGCAVAVPGHGLVVPVIKGADGLNVTGMARTTHELATKARAKKLSLDELQGGTFTFSNVGSFGTLFATPIILQPQVGIMAAGMIKKRPVVVSDEMGNDAIAIRSLMYLTHSYDHRIIDGELGGRFLAAVRSNLETMGPSSLF